MLCLEDFADRQVSVAAEATRSSVARAVLPEPGASGPAVVWRDGAQRGGGEKVKKFFLKNPPKIFPLPAVGVLRRGNGRAPLKNQRFPVVLVGRKMPLPRYWKGRLYHCLALFADFNTLLIASGVS